MEFIRKYIGIWDKIKLAPSEPFLHFNIIEAKTVLSSDFVALGKMINPLEFVEPFIEIALARGTRPEYVPFVWVGEVEVIRFEKRSHKFGIAFEKLVEHLTIVYVIAALGSNCWWSIVQQLVLLDSLYVHLLIEGLVWRCENIAGQILKTLLHVFGVLLIEILLSSTLSIISSWNEKWNVKFNISECVKYFHKTLSTDFFVKALLSLLEHAFFVAHRWRAWPAAVVRIDANPLCLVLRLNHFKSVESRHIFISLSRYLIRARLSWFHYWLLLLSTHRYGCIGRQSKWTYG